MDGFQPPSFSIKETLSSPLLPSLVPFPMSHSTGCHVPPHFLLPPVPPPTSSHSLCLLTRTFIQRFDERRLIHVPPPRRVDHSGTSRQRSMCTAEYGSGFCPRSGFCCRWYCPRWLRPFHVRHMRLAATLAAEQLYWLEWGYKLEMKVLQLVLLPSPARILLCSLPFQLPLRRPLHCREGLLSGWARQLRGGLFPPPGTCPLLPPPLRASQRLAATTAFPASGGFGRYGMLDDTRPRYCRRCQPG
ncbi:hypothetical protein VaNZ11_014471 [Volvox africanus]|uniref:Uncharacterized protein n=1 Tax=Volvox africanus TaxID=51714 RepID=A0ABQ5SJI6_9CHLO|nr:hypothetical protein VaNZ11_014471 [Volvox africanus]